jgi:hypothetical protein
MAQITLNSTGVASSGALALQSNGTTTAVTIDASQNVGIGTASPQEKLDLVSTYALVGSNRTNGTTKLFALRQPTRAGTNDPTTVFSVTNGSSANALRIGGDDSGNFSNSTAVTEIGFFTGSTVSTVNGSERMRIDSSGNVGIGTSSPTEKITVNGGVAVKGAYSGTSNGGAVNITYNTGTSTGAIYALDPTVAWKTLDISSLTTTFGISGSERMRLDSSGNLLVYSSVDGVVSASSLAAGTSNNIFLGKYSATSTTTGTTCYAVRTNGNVINTNNSYGAISDAKLKENITDATPKLEKLNQVRVVNFNMIGEEQKQIGVIAQEVEQIFPSMVDESPDYEEVTTTDEDGNETTERVATGTTTKSVKYSVFVPILIKALQEQQALITTLTDRITALEQA